MTSIALQTRLHRFQFIFLIPLLGALFSLIATRIVDPVNHPNSDFFTFWLSGRLTISGQNPYLADIWIGGHHQFGASWIPNTTFIYPLPIALVFAPLSLFSLYQAFVIWVILSQFMILSSVMLLLKSYPAALNQRFLLPLLAGVALFRPAMLSLMNGQLSALLLLILTITSYFWEKGKWWQGSIFLPLLALKPNLGIPIILGLSFYLILRRQTPALIAGGLAGMGLIIAGLVLNGNWIIEFWRAGNTKLSTMFGFSPTIWGVSAFFCKYNPGCTFLYGGFISLLVFIGLILLLVAQQKTLSPTSVISLVIPAVLLLTPYTWSYDQLLLQIPIITLTMSWAKRGYRFLPIALLSLAIDILAFFMLGISARLERDLWNVMIPLSVLLLLLWQHSTDRLVPAEAQPA